MKWYIPDCFWHSKSNGVFPSHEAVCVLNTNESPVDVELTLYFEDREKLGGYCVTIPGERTRHIRLDKLVNKDGIPIPKDIGYAIVIECKDQITIQYTRLDTSQAEMAIATTNL